MGDGSCPRNNSDTAEDDKAGWGIFITDDNFTMDNYGPVVLDENSPFFIGAEKGTNNTGEISAIAMALLWIQTKEKHPQKYVIRYDSEYAAKMTQGEWIIKENVGLVR